MTGKGGSSEMAEELRILNLNYLTEDDLERGAIRNYDYFGPTKLPRRNDQTPELPPGVGKIPMPYPGYGFEFSNRLSKHLRIRLSRFRQGAYEAQTATSNRDLDDTPGFVLWRLDIHRKTAVNRLVEVLQQLIPSVTLGGATGDRRDFGPIAPFFGIVDHDLELHGCILSRLAVAIQTAGRVLIPRSWSKSRLGNLGHTRSRRTSRDLRGRQPRMSARGSACHLDGRLRLAPD